jgi:hypothetical protein
VSISKQKLQFLKQHDTDRYVEAKSQQYLALSTVDKTLFQLAAIDDVLFWTRLTWVQFSYIYKDNAKNRRLGRVGQSAGNRFGTRNLKLIPANRQPKSRNPSTVTIRYFDTGKFGTIRDATGKYKKADGGVVSGLWRSFGYDKVVVLTKVWSFKRNKFVTDFTEYFV